MAAETILHSGSFLDYDDNTIEVKFFRHTDLNASPSSLSFTYGGGTLRLTIWSRCGNAHLVNPSVDWLTYTPAEEPEPIVGTNYYKYFYDIVCSSNSGDARDTNLVVDLHAEIPGVSINIPVHQGSDDED